MQFSQSTSFEKFTVLIINTFEYEIKRHATHSECKNYAFYKEASKQIVATYHTNELPYSCSLFVFLYVIAKY